MKKEGQALLRIVSFFLFLFFLLLVLFCLFLLLFTLFPLGWSWKQEVSGGIKTVGSTKFCVVGGEGERKVQESRCKRVQEQISLPYFPTPRCPAWAGQARAMWKKIGRLCEKRGPATPPVLAMFVDQRAAREAWFQWLLRGVDGGGRRKTARERRAGRARPRMHFPFVSFLYFLSFSNFSGEFGEKEKEDPTRTGYVGLRSRKNGHVKKPPPTFRGSNPPPSLFSPPRRIVLLASARRLPASFSHSRGRRLSSTSWCPLFCGRGLGLGPQRRDRFVSGSTSPSVDSAFTLLRERADPHCHIVRPE